MQIDSLSIGTRGLQETGGPIVSQPRDQLRIGTRGYLVLDLATLPDPGDVLCLEFVNDAIDLLVGNAFVDCESGSEFTDFNVQDQC